MNAEPAPPPPDCPEAELAVARLRIAELEEALGECRQELKAAAAIIEELDWRIEELKAQLEGADRMLDEGVEARRALERRLAEAEASVPDEACPLVILTPLEQDRRNKE